VSGDLPPSAQALAGKATERLFKLSDRHGTSEIALLQAKALVNATVVEADPRQRQALAARIGEILLRHETPEIAELYARAIASAGLPQPE
jgi:hypothetical protein